MWRRGRGWGWGRDAETWTHLLRLGCPSGCRSRHQHRSRRRECADVDHARCRGITLPHRDLGCYVDPRFRRCQPARKRSLGVVDPAGSDGPTHCRWVHAHLHWSEGGQEGRRGRAMKGPERRWQKRGLISFGLGFLLFIVAAGTIELEGANVLTWIMLAASGIFVVAAFILIALRPRSAGGQK